ncbi:MAG: T9SS type A sorting domain-containing protein, partial [Chitinophagales bacterium]|nr:T9SS type A sorting domain-containing protein [Chitinophagales bacterium]
GSTIGSAMVATCSGTFTDNGGFDPLYANNIGSSTFPIYETFCPAIINNCLRAQFYKAYIKSTDKLNIRNGPASSNAKLGSITNTACGSYAACMAKGYGPYTSSDPSGCLTFDFYSNSFSNDTGWVATFDCIPCATGPNGLDNNDCANVTSLCTNTTFSDASTGPGIVADVNDACLVTETYSNWYTFEVVTGGTLNMTINPLSTGSGVPDDYDWAMYGPNITCGNLGSPIRCSSATTQLQNNNTGNTGNTGISSVSNDLYSNYCGAPYNDNTETACGNCWVEDLTVVAGQTYYLCVSKWSSGGSGFDLTWTLTNGATIDCPVLPISLTNFECSPAGNSISLTWTTASEFNNAYFVVEHSTDGENYETLATVPGKTYSVTPTQYFTLDQHPAAGTNYYRLKQVDTNGTETILKTTSCQITDGNENVQFQIFDLAGRLMYSTNMIITDFNSQLHAVQLPTGVYVTAIIHKNGSVDLGKYLKVN